MECSPLLHSGYQVRSFLTGSIVIYSQSITEVPQLVALLARVRLPVGVLGHRLTFKTLPREAEDKGANPFGPVFPRVYQLVDYLV